MAEQPDDLESAIASECSRLEEDCLYSAKGSFEAASTWHDVHLGLGIPTVIAAGVAGVSAFGNFPFLAGTLAVAVAALSSVSTFLNPSQKEQTYHLTGSRYNGLRARARLLREVSLRTGAGPTELAAELKAIVEAKDKLAQESPIIPRTAFERARQGIEAGEADYRIDKPTPR